MRDEVAELRGLLAAALARIEVLEAATATGGPARALEVPTGEGRPGDVQPAAIDRRRVFGLLAGAGAATAGAVLLGAQPAAAEVGDSVRVGYETQSPGPCYIYMTGNSAHQGFAVYDGPDNNFLVDAAVCGAASRSTFDYGVHGRGKGTSGGVRADAADAGIAVYGTSNTNVAVAGEAQSSYGVSGKSQTNVGVYGYTAGSTYAGVFGDSSAAQGVHGRSVSNVGVYGESTSTTATGAYGVQAVSAGGTGLKATGKVYGVVAQSYSTTATDSAVFATTIQATAIGAYADSGLVMSGRSETGGGVEVKAPTFHLRLANATTRNAPTADAFAHQAGEIVQSTAGDTWVCVKGGTPGTWRKLAGQATSGSFHVLPAPVRVYDSRPGTAPATGPKTPLTGNTARTIDLRGNSSGVPAGATAALVTVLLLNTASGNGNFTLWANGVAKPSANTMVWGGAAGGRYTAKEVSALDSNAQIQVSSSLKADVALDVVGYYR
ncbi:hypothetical protein KSP35_20490 [Aquihabitans sp. G128]|uniref:hypothetical protein n=1 Tax=Aquihabitans sp. G128 TaxID=2849779 RepID=UPI001C23C354|nr:hypothetical protein [Aquihabitans sp. G128]QXC60672.1 hypothetical protein KSP35_20490 [Aquihabitans sp. G128]